MAGDDPFVTLETLRNGEYHGTEKHQGHTKRLEQLERNLTAIYLLQTEVLASDCNIFDTRIEDLFREW
jgi:hypothetical protein